MNKFRQNNLENYKFDESIKLTSFSTMYIYNFKKDYKGILESHRQYELLTVNKGSIVTVEDGKEYFLQTGEAFLHKPYSLHQDKNNHCSSQVCIISFLTKSQDLSMLFDQKLILTKEQMFMLNNIFSYVSKYIAPTTQFWFSGKKNIIPENTPYGFKQIIKNKLELFFISLIESKQKTKFYPNPSYTPLTEKVVDLLKQNIYEKFSLDRIADTLSYSKNYICRHFKNNTGYTINTYFYDLKISEAKQLLTETDKSINQISEILNFETVQYFSLCFKKNVGVSPSIFRKNAQKERFY